MARRQSFAQPWSQVWNFLPVRDYYLGPLSFDKPSGWLGALVQTGWGLPAPHSLTDYWDQTHLQDKRPRTEIWTS